MNPSLTAVGEPAPCRRGDVRTGLLCGKGNPSPGVYAVFDLSAPGAQHSPCAYWTYLAEDDTPDGSQDKLSLLLGEFCVPC